MTLESRLTLICKVFACFTYSSAILYCAAPSMLIAHAYFTGTTTNTTYEAPFHDLWEEGKTMYIAMKCSILVFYRYIIPTTETPLFHIFYTLYSLGVNSIVIIFLSKNFAFSSICLYLVALFDGLKAMFQTIDNQASRGDRIRVLTQCVQFHKTIIGYYLYYSINSFC